MEVCIYMDQRCQSSDLSFSAGEGLGQGVDDQLIGELEEGIRHGRGPVGIARCCDGLSRSQVASRKSKAKSIVVASTAGDAPRPLDFSPQAWRIAGAGLGLPAVAGCRHPTMLGAKPRKGIPPQHCHNFFGIADASRFKDQTPNHGLFTCSYPRADFDMSLLMNFFLPWKTALGSSKHLAYKRQTIH